MSNVQIISILFATFFLLEVAFLIKKNKLHDKHAFLWIAFAVVGIIIASSLHQLNHLSKILGISYMPTFIFVMAFFVVLSMLIYQTSILSRQQQSIKNLVQELAYLNKEVEDLTTQPNKDKEENVNEH